MHPVEALRRRLAECRCYPAGVVPIAEFIGGTAAFPAGCGLYRPGYDDPLPPFPMGGVLVVAHNVDAEDTFVARLRAREPHGGIVRRMPYWSGMYPLLRAAEIDASECFFTNVFVGLRRGSKPEGPLDLGRTADFRDWCTAFLADQIRLIQPRAVAVMGRPAWRFMGRMSADLSGWLDRDVRAEPVRADLAGVVTVAVPMLHTSGQGRFMHRRGYRTVDEAVAREAALLRRAAGG